MTTKVYSGTFATQMNMEFNAYSVHGPGLIPLCKHHAKNASEVRIGKHDGTLERLIVQFFNHASRDTAVC